MVTASNPTGSIEFSCPTSVQDHFFPIKVSFVSKVSYVDLAVKQITKIEDESSVPFSMETVFYPEKYQIG